MEEKIKIFFCEDDENLGKKLKSSFVKTMRI